MGLECNEPRRAAEKEAFMTPEQTSDQDSLRGRVEHVLELIRPAIQSDGGDVELVDISEDGVVQVRFHGDCVGCPSSFMTLQQGIEKNLKANVPEVTSVVATEE
jgi:Fe-S cluster biogenesis protein NfuA